MILAPAIMLPTSVEDIVFRGVSSKRAFAGSGSISVSWPAGTQIGDLGILWAQTDQGDSVDPTPAGWALDETEDTGECRLHVFSKEITSLSSFTVANTGDHLICAAMAFGNVDMAAHYGGTAANDPASSSALTLSSSVSIPNDATIVDRAFVVSAVGHDIASDGGSNVAFNTNASLEGGGEQLADYCTSAGWDGGFGVYGGIKALAGAVNNTTGTLTANKRRAYISFALKPRT